MEPTVNDSNMQGPERMSRSLLKTKRVLKKSPSRLSPSRRSPGRPRKNSPIRRSPSRRSPSRRSPARRSPARSPVKRSPPSKKVPTRNIRIAQVSLSHTDVPKVEDRMKVSKTDVDSAKDMDEVTELIPLQSRMKESAQITRRSTRILSNMMKIEHDQRLISATRNADRAVSLPVDRRVHMYDFAAIQRERGLSMQRERDISKIMHYEEEALPDSSTTTEKSKKEIELVSKPQEWGGWIGALCLIFVLPMVIILPQIACFNNQCNIGKLRIPIKLQSYLNLHAIGLYMGFLSVLALSSLLPVGKLIDGQQTKIGRLQYRMNGIVPAVLMIIILAVFEYKGYPTVDFILNSCLQLSVAGWILGTVLAIGLYIKGDRMSVAALNMYGSTNNFVYDFWQGREVNPRIGRLDVKVLLLRANVIGTLMLNSAVVAKLIHDADSLAMKDLNFTALIVGSLQIFYCLDYLVFESALLTSFKILYEGTGYLVCVGNLLNPFLLTLASRYLLYQKTNQSIYVLAASVALFFVGYAIYRMSNSQKNEFRKNPFSPALSYLDTISTSRGKRIITSGFWGYVRHPNYLGDIIIHWSIACAALSKDLLPYYAAILCTLTLVYRAIRDDRRCRHRYGSSWEQYCLRVKSMIVNRVF